MSTFNALCMWTCNLWKLWLGRRVKHQDFVPFVVVFFFFFNCSDVEAFVLNILFGCFVWSFCFSSRCDFTHTCRPLTSWTSQLTHYRVHARLSVLFFVFFCFGLVFFRFRPLPFSSQFVSCRWVEFRRVMWTRPPHFPPPNTVPRALAFYSCIVDGVKRTFAFHCML